MTSAPQGREPGRRPFTWTYEVLWLVVAVLVGSVGALAGWHSLNPLDLVMCAGAGGLAGAGCYWMLAHGLEPGLRPLRVDRLLRAALAGAAGGWVLVGLSSLSGASGTVVLLVVLALSPPALRAYAQLHLQSVLRPARVGAVPLASLTTGQLGTAWRASCTALGTAASPTERLRVVQLREQLLGELERCDPAAFTAWLTEGAGDRTQRSGPDGSA